MIQRIVHRLAQWPSIFDLLRWILEGGYRGHKTVISGELGARQGMVLDIGCGTGSYSQFFDADSYLGLDLSPIYISAASRKYPRHQFIVANARQLPLPKNCIPAALISGVLHHLPSDVSERVLAETARVLAIEGQLIVWEDIPTVAWWNFIGHLIHRLDLGRHIRQPNSYRALLDRHFTIRSERLMRSGFMDYVVFACSPRTPHEAPVSAAFG